MKVMPSKSTSFLSLPSILSLTTVLLCLYLQPGLICAQNTDAAKYSWVQMSGSYQKDENIYDFASAFDICKKWKLYLPIIQSQDDIEQITKLHLHDQVPGKKLRILLGHKYEFGLGWVDYLGDDDKQTRRPVVNSFLASLKSPPDLQHPKCAVCHLFLEFEPRADPIWQINVFNASDMKSWPEVTRRLYCANRTKVVEGPTVDYGQNVSAELNSIRRELMDIRGSTGLRDPATKPLSTYTVILICLCVSIVTTVTLVAITATLVYVFVSKQKRPPGQVSEEAEPMTANGDSPKGLQSSI